MLAKRNEIEIRIGNVDLVTKLDALGAAISAVREAHRGDMSPKAWAALHRAQDAIAEAMIFSAAVGRRQLSQGGNYAPDQKAGYNTTAMPVGKLIVPAGTSGA